jgi:hypothetical protein
LSLSE